MMSQFIGSIDELKSHVESCGYKGDWKDSINQNATSHQFRARGGEILNWWPAKGTLSFQGKNAEAFSKALSSVISGEVNNSDQKPVEVAQRIFIVHGHDSEARDQLELVLRRLGLEPFILQNSDGGGKTIIEALEQHIYEESSFGIILMTPDDFGYPKLKTEADRQPRARQNVILEMGMIMASLGREKMAILQKGTLERPSDTDGILRIEFNGHVREIVPKLAQRLQTAGFKIDPQKIAAASA
jgi:predicted nucleotide-binding protein